jgi:nicotinate phosphoribosyltransferase
VPHTADIREIKAGKITDVYFTRTREILKAKKADKWVKAEFTAKALPCGWAWAVLSGIEECVEILKDLKVSVRAMKEGTIFQAHQPVLELEGMYTEFGLYETALLGLICQASGIATKAARCKKLAGERKVISFGARRMHPSVVPMIERSAYIGGCDGVAVAKSAELIDEEPVGTMPHALILILGDTVEALKGFHAVIDPNVKRVALVDTLGDEKFEAVRAAEALGRDLYAVRLDTPASRRGNFLRILQEVRWELDLRGYQHVKLFVSGGIDEAHISQLNPLVDAYGIGTSISNAPVVDFAMDIIEVEGKPMAKRGKLSGAKRVLRCSSCYRYEVIPHKYRKDACTVLSVSGGGSGQPCGGAYEELLIPLLKDGQLFGQLPSPKAIRSDVLKQVHFFGV